LQIHCEFLKRNTLH